MKIKLLILITIMIFYFFRKDIYPYFTNVSGKIYIKDDYLYEIKPNAMLYITLHNDKGIIFAVKQIINPKFPLKFKITYKNVLYPKLATPKCNIKAILNYHGNIYEIKNGDLYSDTISTFIINPRVKISLDKKKIN